MSDNSNGFYKSKVFKFINRQYQKISEKSAIALRYLKIALEWSLQIAASGVYALMQAGQKLKDKLTGGSKTEENKEIAGDRQVSDREIAPTPQAREQFTPQPKARVGLLEFKETLAAPPQETVTKKSEKDNQNEAVTEDIDYRELEEFTEELRQELDEYVEKEIQRNQEENDKIEQIQIKAEKGDWVKEAGSISSWEEEAGNLNKASWVEEAQKTIEFSKAETVETEKEDWIQEISERVTEIEREETKAKAAEFAKEEVKTSEFAEVESTEKPVNKLEREETKASQFAAELDSLDEEIAGLEREENKAKAAEFADLESIGEEMAGFKWQEETKAKATEFNELDNIVEERTVEVEVEKSRSVVEEYNKVEEPAVQKEQSEYVRQEGLVFVPRRDRRRIRVKIKDYTANVIIPKVSKFFNEGPGAKVKVVVTKTTTTIERFAARNESLANILARLKATTATITDKVKTGSQGKLATQIKEKFQLAAGKGKIIIAQTTETISNKEKRDLVIAKAKSVAIATKETISDKEKRDLAIAKAKSVAIAAKETISDRERREKILEQTKTVISDSVEYILDKSAEYSAKIRNQLDKLEINANITKFLEPKEGEKDTDLELKSSVLSGIKNYIDDKRKDSPSEDRQISPDWIETKATTVGYVKHPLERILGLLDRIMFAIEELVAKIWDWSKDKIEKIRNR